MFATTSSSSGLPAVQESFWSSQGPGALLWSVLDEIDYGLLLVGAAGVLWCNRAARQSLGEADPPLRLTARGLAASDPSAQVRLQAALDAALRRGLRKFVLIGSASRAVPAAVVPLAGRDEETGYCFVMLGRRSLCSEPSAHWFSASHGLTSAESGVLASLLEGLRPRDIASRNGVALSTVRTHIASIRNKTAFRCVGDLLRCAAALPSMRPISQDWAPPFPVHVPTPMATPVPLSMAAA